MPINTIIVDGYTGGINTNVVRVITQTIETSDPVVIAEPNKGYVLTDSLLQTITIPTYSFGDIFYFQGRGSGLFRIVQTASQQIFFGDKSTTLGVSGYIESTDANDGLFIICSSSSNTFTVMPASQGVFDIDGTTTQNAINDTSLVGGITLTSSGNNVDITGGPANFDLNVGKATDSDAVAITNVSVPDVGPTSVAIGQDAAQSNHGNARVSIGFRAGQISGGSTGVAIGVLAGKSGQGAQAIAIGQNAGENAQGARAIAIGAVCGTQADTETVSIGYGCGAGCCPYVVNVGAFSGGRGGNYSVNLGYNSGDGIVDPNFSGDYSVSIGANCLASSVDGRLSFGNNMEPVTSIGAGTSVQQGWYTQDWNGTTYRIPLYNDTAEENLSEKASQIAMIKMTANLWAGHSFAFTTSFQELIPSGASYSSVLPANFTNPSNGQIQYIGAETREFKIACVVDTDQTGNNYAIALGVNGIVQLASETYSVSVGSMTLNYVQILSQNDIVTAQVLRSANANRNINSFFFSVEA